MGLTVPTPVQARTEATTTPSVPRPPEAAPPRSRPAAGWIGWCIVAIAGIAAGISGYLLWRTLAEAGAPPGCGPDSGCEQVLSSRWSTWMNLPVAAPAVAA